MEKITKKVLLEEINKINKMMGLSPKKTLNEQISKVAGELAPKFGEFLLKSGRKVAATSRGESKRRTFVNDT